MPPKDHGRPPLHSNDMGSINLYVKPPLVRGAVQPKPQWPMGKGRQEARVAREAPNPAH